MSLRRAELEDLSSHRRPFFSIMPISHDSDTAKVISNPLSLIYGLFNQANQPVADERDWGVEAYFSRLFQDTSARDLVSAHGTHCLLHLLNDKL